MATVASGNETQPRQNWVVSPVTDMLLIIAAPLLAFAWSAIVFRAFGHQAVWTIFMIFNIAHHFPTFIRIYGDKDCVRRFRWSLALGPIIPFTASLLLAGYLITNGISMDRLIFLWMILTLWDPWHFLMQHYGFMRIYDRFNEAPRRLASWMDYLVSATWFVFIMMAAAQWFCGELLYSLYNDHGLPFLTWVNPQVYRGMLAVSFGAAGLMTVVYGGYVWWCRRRGFFVSHAKLLLLVITFGVMYITYVPGSFFREIFPGWTYATGFATLGMVHVTQYLAIVWTYNRGLAKKGKKRSRPGLFTSAFAKGGLVVVSIYVGICLLYGTLLSGDVAPAFHFARIVGLDGQALQWVFGILWAIMFTSTFTHYYYDGFIWKVRHKENRENLAMQAAEDKSLGVAKAKGAETVREPVASWWERGKRNTPGATLLRQSLYFGLPIAILIVTYGSTQGFPSRPDEVPKTPLKMVQYAEMLKRAGAKKESLALAQTGLKSIQQQLVVERTVSELDAYRRASHQTYVADLTYWGARAKLELVTRPQREPTTDEIQAYRQGIREAIAVVENVLAIPGEQKYGHREAQGTNRDDLGARLKHWRAELKQLPP